MAKVFIEESTLTAIGDSIREKTGKTELIDPALMSAEIKSIEAGGGPDIPEEAFVLSGSLQNRFCNGNWDWFVELYGNKMTTTDVSTMSYAFNLSNLRVIPFDINLKSAASLGNAFGNMHNLEVCPRLRGTLALEGRYNDPSNVNFESIITDAYRLRDVSDLVEDSLLDFFKEYKCTSSYSMPKPITFSGNYSLRSVPSWWYKFRFNKESTAFPYSGYTIYYRTAYQCYALDELKNVPVWTCLAAPTSNMFSYTVGSCGRLKDFTFETDNGQPIEANWKAQVLDMSDNAGHFITMSASVTYLYNSGITKDKEVTDDATYQALKNDPDWFTGNADYSRYNHDSAVNTINSLPDTSAYLATAGGTNTIKFKGVAGSKTDGGAINTLTAEEIAVAAAKGWTVTLV